MRGAWSWWLCGALLWGALGGGCHEVKPDPGVQGAQTLAPPVARVEPKALAAHGETRTDNYYWLRDDARQDPEVIQYLNDENAYTKAVLRDTEALQNKLFEEMKARLKEDDASVPYALGGYWYYTRYEPGKEYPIYCRRKGSMQSPEEVMLDANAEGKGLEFYDVGDVEVSDGKGLLAYSEDALSRRIYTIKVKDLATGQRLPDEIPGAAESVVWGGDDKTLFYIKREEGTLRAYQVWRHALGTPAAQDVMVYEEKDEAFELSLRRTKSRKYLVVSGWSTLSTEERFLDASKPTGEFQVFLPREAVHEYAVEHAGSAFYIRTNWGAKNYRLMSVAEDKTQDKGAWKEVIPGRDDVFLDNFDVFKDHLVLQERKGGQLGLRVLPWADMSQAHELAFDQPVYSAYLGQNVEFESKTLRFEFESLATPGAVYDFDMVTHAKTLMKQDEVLGGFDEKNYTTERVWFEARDGTKVPISLVYRKDLDRSKPQPLYQYGYGSYGYSMDPYFSVGRVSLLDRGFIYAVVHIRGGQEMGRGWYEDGKLGKKRNTFYDFIDGSKFLIGKGYTAPDRLFAAGGSAGGLLVGAVSNLAPELYKGIVADVPFVDVVTTMLDETIPLTTFEYDEWGNPNEEAAYRTMLAYSPYDQVKAQAYPNMLVTTGLHDSQVQYWEPAKWVAKLRATKTDTNLLLLSTNMDAGHGGASGRFQRYREVALEYAFLLKLLGRAD
jgi:oligopeptidase B